MDYKKIFNKSLDFIKSLNVSSPDCGFGNKVKHLKIYKYYTNPYLRLLNGNVHNVDLYIEHDTDHIPHIDNYSFKYFDDGYGNYWLFNKKTKEWFKYMVIENYKLNYLTSTNYCTCKWFRNIMNLCPHIIGIRSQEKIKDELRFNMINRNLNLPEVIRNIIKEYTY